MGKSYVERKEDEQDIYGNPFQTGGEPNTAKPMLERTDTNRILVSDDQAQLLNLLKMHHGMLLVVGKTKDFQDLITKIGIENHLDIQTAQLTRDSMSREDYIRALNARSKQKKGLFDMFSRKQSSTPDTSDAEGDD